MIQTQLAASNLNTLQSTNQLGSTLQAAATQNLITSLQSFNTLGTAVQEGFNSVSSLTQTGFNSANQQALVVANNAAMQTANGFNDVKTSLNAISAQNAACCCELKEAIRNSTEAILNNLNSTRIQDLQIENSNLKQTATIAALLESRSEFTALAQDLSCVYLLPSAVPPCIRRASMSNNVTATISIPPSVAGAISAHAALQTPPSTLEAMIVAYGVDGALVQALQSELRAQVIAGAVGSDLKDAVASGFNPLWNVAWQVYTQAKTSTDPNLVLVPESLLAGLQARASKLKPVSAPAPAGVSA